VGSLTDLGNSGQTKLEASAANQRALLAVANDLQSASSDTDPVTGTPRFTVGTGATVEGLRNKRNTPSGKAVGLVRKDLSAIPLDESLDTAEERLAAEQLGTGRHRARGYEVPSNSLFTFRKVTGYTIDEGTGEVSPIWSTPISYSVNENRHLVRLQDGVERVVGRDVSLFDVRTDDLGNFIVTLVTERHDRKGNVERIANRIEVHPKNK
jgi:hypothetical protein